jgi:hypothetical protein
MRYLVIAPIVLALALGPGAMLAAEAEPSAGGTLSAAGALAEPRIDFTATLLPDGRVLVVGGWDGGKSAKAEVWDPETLAFAPAGELAQPRAGHTAVLQPDGRVLIVGGTRDDGRIADAEMWNPVTATFSDAGSLKTARRQTATVTALTDGRILIVGGARAEDRGPALAVELWDPASMSFERAGRLDRPRNGHHTFALPGGGAVIVGPGKREALYWDPGTMRLEPAGQPAERRSNAYRLSDGRVLFVGVNDPVTCQKGKRYASTPDAEVWLPAKRSFRPAGAFKEPRGAMSVTPLADGGVLFYGGWSAVCKDSTPLRTAELWAPASRSFERAGRTTVGREGHTATLLNDGRVVFIGGQGQSPPHYVSTTLDAVEVWDPATRAFSRAESLATPRWGHTQILLSDGRVLVVGGWGPGDDLLVWAEVWDPGDG